MCGFVSLYLLKHFSIEKTMFLANSEPAISRSEAYAVKTQTILLIFTMAPYMCKVHCCIPHTCGSLLLECH